MILEEELIKAKQEPYTEYFDKSYVIINDPNTGEILAMAGKQIKVNSDGSYSIYDYTPGVITSSVTPGSIVKGASHIVGYNNNALDIGEIRNDACIKIAATPLKCSFTEYGNINDMVIPPLGIEWHSLKRYWTLVKNIKADFITIEERDYTQLC